MYAKERPYRIAFLTEEGKERLSWSMPEEESRDDYRAIINDAGETLAYCVRVPFARCAAMRTADRVADPYYEDVDIFRTASGSVWIWFRDTITGVDYIAKIEEDTTK